MSKTEHIHLTDKTNHPNPLLDTNTSTIRHKSPNSFDNPTIGEKDIEKSSHDYRDVKKKQVGYFLHYCCENILTVT